MCEMQNGKTEKEWRRESIDPTLVCSTEMYTKLHVTEKLRADAETLLINVDFSSCIKFKPMITVSWKTIKRSLLNGHTIVYAIMGQFTTILQNRERQKIER